MRVTFRLVHHIYSLCKGLHNPLESDLFDRQSLCNWPKQIQEGVIWQMIFGCPSEYVDDLLCQRDKNVGGREGGIL